MPECDGVFDDAGIPFEPGNEDLAVNYAYSTFGTDPAYAKFLIQCWFDTTYGEWNGSRFDMKDSRAKMSTWLRGTKYATFEALLEDPNFRRQDGGQNKNPTDR